MTFPPQTLVLSWSGTKYDKHPRQNRSYAAMYSHVVNVMRPSVHKSCTLRTRKASSFNSADFAIAAGPFLSRRLLYPCFLPFSLLLRSPLRQLSTSIGSKFELLLNGHSCLLRDTQQSLKRVICLGLSC